jgi:hypothetical protein
MIARLPRRRRISLLVALTAVAFAVASCGGERSGAARGGPITLPNPSKLGESLPSRLPFSSGSGGTFWVDVKHGSDRNRGTKRHPWRTITRALRTVPLRGSVIKVMPGTYYPNGNRYAILFRRHGDVDDPVTVRPARPGTVTIANEDPRRATFGAWIIGASGLRLVGLRFRVLSAPHSNIPASGILIENSHRIEVTRSTFEEMGSMGVVVRGGVGASSDDVWLISNTFRPSGPDPTAQATGLGFDASNYFGSKGSHWVYAGQYGTNSTWEQVSGTRRLVVVNNVFSGTAAGRDVELGPQARNSFVVDNTFYGNQPSGVIGSGTDAVYAGQGVMLFSNTSSKAYTNGYNTIANNLFVGLNGHAVAGSGPSQPGNQVLNNMFWRIAGKDFAGDAGSPLAPSYGESSIFSVGPQNRTRNPALRKPQAYDFHPARASAAGGAADPSYTYPYDADGRLRPRRPAIGALEPR